MEFGVLIRKMTQAACEGDGVGVAACFTEGGVYHDVFYGSFEGRGRIAEMINDNFHRDACNFRWDMHDPVSDGETGYCRYVFSYESKIDDARGTRTMFEGVAIAKIQDGLIVSYTEVANTAPGLRRMGFAADRLARFAEKQEAELAARKEAEGHL